MQCQIFKLGIDFRDCFGVCDATCLDKSKHYSKQTVNGVQYSVTDCFFFSSTGKVVGSQYNIAI